jgi:hypothetical protein
VEVAKLKQGSKKGHCQACHSSSNVLDTAHYADRLCVVCALVWLLSKRQRMRSKTLAAQIDKVDDLHEFIGCGEGRVACR